MYRVNICNHLFHISTWNTYLNHNRQTRWIWYLPSNKRKLSILQTGWGPCRYEWILQRAFSQHTNTSFPAKQSHNEYLSCHRSWIICYNDHKSVSYRNSKMFLIHINQLHLILGQLILVLRLKYKNDRLRVVPRPEGHVVLCTGASQYLRHAENHPSRLSYLHSVKRREGKRDETLQQASHSSSFMRCTLFFYFKCIKKKTEERNLLLLCPKVP